MDMLIAKRYVKALVEAVGERKVASATKSLERVAKAFEDKKFAELMISPEVKKSQKEELVMALSGEKVDPKISNFIKVLNIHGRLGLIPEIVRQLQKELQRRANKYEGLVESSVKLDKKELSELEKSLSKYVDATVVLRQVKSREEGIKVVIEDLGLEASFSKERVASDMINHILKAL
ncbi:MAG: F0F1 ATP synthase subunit delta [Hydrogenimonas sp.]|nr:F0F1 ATP synthase subunit delta [Hydrogenimonas sp.]